MEKVQDIIRENELLRDFKIYVTVYNCLEEDEFKSYIQKQKEELRFNEHIADKSVIISVYKDWTRFESYDTRLYVNDFPISNRERELSSESRIIQALDTFQGYSKA